MLNDWKINKITAFAEHSSGLRCRLSLDTIHKNGLKVSFLNEHDYITINGNSRQDMKNLGEEYIKLVKSNCQQFSNKTIRVWTDNEEKIYKNKSNFYNREMGRKVLYNHMKMKDHSF